MRKKIIRMHRGSTSGQTSGVLSSNPVANQSKINLSSYSKDYCSHVADFNFAHINAYRTQDRILWLEINGLADLQLIRTIGETFKLHSLALEDVIHVHQRPKVEYYDDFIYIVTRIVTTQHEDAEQVSIFVGHNFVITFRETAGKEFEPIHERLGKTNGRIRESGSDYLVYMLLDIVIDGYFDVLEEYSERVDELEGAVLRQPQKNLINDIHFLKHDLLTLKRFVWSHRELLNSLLRDDTPLIQEHSHVYFRDIYDHIAQQLDIVETYRDITSGLIDVYLSNMSTRTNEIIKVLTFITTIFMPLSFIAGLYGMNFDRHSPWNMPELGWRYGYFFALTLMLSSTFGLYFFFKKKGWIASSKRKTRE